MSEIRREVELARKFGLPAEFVARVPLPFRTAGRRRLPRPGAVQSRRAIWWAWRRPCARRAAASTSGALRDRRQEEEPSLGRERGQASHPRAARDPGVAHADRPPGALRRHHAAALPHRDGVPRARGRGRRHVHRRRRSDALAAHGRATRKGPLLVVLASQVSDRSRRRRRRAVSTRSSGGCARTFPPRGRRAGAGSTRTTIRPITWPYAGALPRPQGLYVAVGFGGWGISNGAAAGLLIAEQVQGRKHPWSALYAPERRARNPMSAATRTRRCSTSPDLRPGEGGVITRGKRKIAVCKARERPPPRVLRRVHARGLHRDVEQCRPHVAVSVPRLDLRRRRQRAARSGDETVEAGETSAQLTRTAVRPNVSPRAPVAA